ncbi:MAG: site-specific DNA-methyltransferase [Gammaproteobacteria bacterium]|nr:site-specific DNA-methyltransferase [Gammaproteobacteria bacterium]
MIHVLKEDDGNYALRPGIDAFTDTIIHGDAGVALKAFPDSHIQCIVTSPPYYRQRDYGDKQLGQEDSPDEYVLKLVGIFRECRRVLREDGTLWLNLGDKYLDGHLLGMPWRVALALITDGWILRSDIIWHKPNAMPSSVKTRPTTDHEYIFMFSKGAGYYYDADAIREPHVTFSENSKMKGGRNHFGKAGGTPEGGKNAGNSNLHTGRWDQAFHPLGRNKRTVWSIPLSKYREAHFAVFPEKLVETCLLAGTSAKSLVLDPFCGSGTTLLVASRLNRHFLGIDCNIDYCKMALERLTTNQADLFLSNQKVQLRKVTC